VGRAEVRRHDGARLDFEMELRIPAFRSKPGEPCHGTVVYRVSEYESERSLLLEESPFDDVRWSWIEVNGWLQTTRCQRIADTLRIEVVVFQPSGPNRAVRAVQRATLRRVAR